MHLSHPVGQDKNDVSSENWKPDYGFLQSQDPFRPSLPLLPVFQTLQDHTTGGLQNKVQKRKQQESDGIIKE